MQNIYKTTVVLFILTFPAYFLYAGNGDYQALYEQGIEAFKSGNFGSAELLLRKVIESGDSDNKDKAWYYFALSVFNQKKYQSAIFEFNRFLSSCSDKDLCSLARYWIAESYYLQNNYIRAIQEFNRFITQTKNNEYITQSYDRIGRIYFSQKRYDEAIIEWTKALSKCDDETKKNQKRLNIGEAYFLNENYEEAINFLKPLLNANIDRKINSMAKLITGRSYQLSEKYSLALKVFSGMDEILLTEKPFNEVQYYRALSYIALGNSNFAVLHLKTFLSTAKDSALIYYAKFELARLYLKENNSKEATELFEDVRKSNAAPRLKSSASIELAKIYFDYNIDESLKCLHESESLESPEEKKEVLLLFGRAYIKVKKFKDAEMIFEDLINNYSFDKNIDLYHFLMANVYFEEEDYEKSVKEFDKIREYNPFSKYINESYYYLALINIKRNQTEEAVNLLYKYTGLEKTEKKYSAYLQILNLYIKKRDFRNSEKIISIIINNHIKENGVEEVLYKYGKFLADNNKSNKSIYDIVVQNFGKSEAAGSILLSRGDEAFVKKAYKEAENYYKQYLTIQWRENAASVFLYRIISLERLGKYKEIISILDSKDTTPPMDDFTSKQLVRLKARSYYNTGEYKKAHDSYLSWRLGDLQNEDLSNLIKSSLKADDVITAKRAAELFPNQSNARAEAFFELSLYYINKNIYDSATEYLSRITIECSSTDYADIANVEMSDICIKEEKYVEAVLKLREIKNDKVLLRKNALLIISYFRTENWKEAITLTKKNFNNLIKSPYEEMVIKENLLYYYKNKDVNEFNEYAQYLKKYPGNGPLINYLSGKLNFENNNYKTSYYYFYKLADIESEFKDEANYYLGLISLLNNKDKNLALKYLKKISEKDDSKSKFAMQGKIDLSILSSELGNIELSRKVLSDILNHSDNRLLRIQAENLSEYFGYNKINTDIE